MILLYYFLQMHVNLELSQNNVKSKISIYSIFSYFQNISIAIIFRINAKLTNLVWPSLIAQLVKNPPAMRETLVQFLDQEDPLEKE